MTSFQIDGSAAEAFVHDNAESSAASARYLKRMTTPLLAASHRGAGFARRSRNPQLTRHSHAMEIPVKNRLSCEEQRGSLACSGVPVANWEHQNLHHTIRSADVSDLVRRQARLGA